jgi:hypothetical protein
MSTTGGDAGSVADVTASGDLACKVGPGSGKSKEPSARDVTGAGKHEVKSLAVLLLKNTSRRRPQSC